MSHDELQAKYNIKAITLLHYKIHSSIPNNWTKSLKEKIYITPLTNLQNSIYINKSKLNVEKVNVKNITGN